VGVNIYVYSKNEKIESWSSMFCYLVRQRQIGACADFVRFRDSTLTGSDDATNKINLNGNISEEKGGDPLREYRN
jgi:hypothetical protein